MARPRNNLLDEKVLEVALRLLSDQGYARMSIDSVAAAAGVSKPAIYRRWPAKADLATAAVRSLQRSEPAVETGSTKGDLAGVLRNFQKNLLRPNGMALVGVVLAEEAHTPELLALFRERLVAPRRAALAKILERAKLQNELRPGVNISAVVTMLVGAFYAHYLAANEIPPDYPEQVVEVVWRGIASETAI